ncbi:MAG: hypothetical protein ACK4VK_07100 [Aquificaceae bacterium]
MLWRIALLIFGFILFFLGQWVAFEIYSFNKLRRIDENISAFIYGLHRGENSIKILYPSENVFVLSTREGKLITSNNALTSPLNTQDFTYANYSKEGMQVSTYTKKITLGEYLATFFENPLAFGISLSGLVVFVMGLALISLGAKTSPETSQESLQQKEDLINKLKALRISLAMGEVIPKESLEEAKKIVDSIIKKYSG